jgi:hypothetical protein
MDGYVSKPIHGPQLLEAIESALSVGTRGTVYSR